MFANRRRGVPANVVRKWATIGPESVVSELIVLTLNTISWGSPHCTGRALTGQRLVATALDGYGRLDILVNNAGVLRDRMIFSMSADEWDLVLRVHLRGHFVTTRFATEHWRAASKQAGGPVYGRIVNTSSEAFLLGSPGQPNYAAAKAGIAALTVSTARGCARYGVRANAICPRARTAMVAGIMSPPPAEGPDPIDPEHVTPLVTYLASPAAERINGEVFVVHGGVAAVMNPPTIRAVFQAGTPDGMWTLPAVHDDVDEVAEDRRTDQTGCGREHLQRQGRGDQPTMACEQLAGSPPDGGR